MPSTLTGVLLFIILLLPGIAYQAALERRGIPRRMTTFRETASVIFAGVVFDLIAVVGTSPIWNTYICFERLASHPRQYWRDNPTTLIWTGLGLLIIAVALAYFVAWLRDQPVVAIP